jgi:tetratricopeptide (TPR) repeat protein
MAGRNEEALAAYRRAAELDPDNFDVRFQLAKTALDLDMPDEAVDHFTAAVRTSGVKPIVHRYLGQALLRAGRRTEAIDAFKAAARFDPEDAPSLSQLGALYLEAGTDPEVALSLTRQSVAQDPSNTLFRQRLARALAAAGFPAEAAAEYERLIGGGLSNRELFFEYGRLQKALDRDDLAVEAFERALEIDPEFGPAADALSALKA